MALLVLTERPSSCRLPLSERALLMTVRVDSGAAARWSATMSSGALTAALHS